MTNPRNRELAGQWLAKADRDLLTVRRMSEGPDAPLDIVCFHAQQAAEKALKAVLVAHDVTPERTHDVLLLLDAVVQYVPALDAEAQNLGAMTDFAIRVRYPGTLGDPSRETATSAGQTARRVHAAAKAHIEELSKTEDEPEEEEDQE